MNLTNYLQFLPQFTIAFFCTLLITPFIGLFARKFNIYDLPGSMRKKDDITARRRIHTIPKPRLGGLGVIITFLILSLLFNHLSTNLFYFLIAVSILLFLGVIDDIYDLPAKLQLIGQIIASIIVIVGGNTIHFINNPFTKGGYVFFNQIPIHISSNTIYLSSALITFIWIFLIINSVKWTAGTDGLVEGNAAIASIIIALLSVRVQTWSTAQMGFIFSGALLGFLPYNFYPSKIFSGSSGKSVYGFVLAMLSIYSGAKLATAILVLSLPIIDALWVIYTRIKEDHPHSIFQLISISDQNHFHHKLLNLGFTQRKIAYIEYSITAIFGILALTLSGLHKALALFAVGCIILISLIMITRSLEKRKKLNSRKIKEESSEKKYIY